MPYVPFAFAYELNYCRFDGSPLVSTSGEEATTILLSPKANIDGAERLLTNGEDSSTAK